MSLLLLPDRILSKIDFSSGPNQCWPWKAARIGGGYGQINWEGKGKRSSYAHRVIWSILRGQIQDGICVLHHCDNPPCCNPKHLFLGTNKDNTRDMIAKGRDKTPASINRAKVKCKRGHSLSPDNLYVCPKGKRYCLLCRRMRDRSPGRRLS